MAKTSERIILVDADVVSHFIRGGEILNLCSIFKTPIKLLDIVYNELEMWKEKKTVVDNLVNFGVIDVIEFPQTNQVIQKEFFEIKKYRYYGDGEAACMSYAKHTSNVVASNNLSDIKNYCDLHKVDYLTTMDFLSRALDNGTFTLEQCNNVIEANITTSRNPFPVKKLEEFKARNMSHIK